MLAVIDLQSCYEKEFGQQRRTFKRLLENLRRRVQAARALGEPVINIECLPDGPTIPTVLDILDGYPTIGKEDYDGSDEIHAYVRRNHLNPGRVELCGAFANVCVLRTWVGLRDFGYEMAPVDLGMVMFTPGASTRVISYPPGYIP